MRTYVTIHMNMGYMDGEEEIKMEEKEAQENMECLIQHMKDIMPEVSDLELESKIESIEFKSLEIGEWSSPETYNLKVTVTLQHETPQSYATITEVIEAIYENGANCSFTPDAEDAMPHRVLYPYSSTVHDHLVCEV